MITIPILFDNFYKIIDYYLINFNNFKLNEKIEFNCNYGTIEFYKSTNTTKIIIHSVYIKEHYRRQGQCKKLIEYLIDNIEKNKILIIQSVLSKILYEYLERFNYKKTIFILKKEGFVAQKI